MSPSFRASVTKIVTAWLALEVLGGDYRFETRFYLDTTSAYSTGAEAATHRGR